MKVQKYTTTQYADAIGKSRQIVWKWCKNNKVPAKYGDVKIDPDRVGKSYTIIVTIK